MYSQRLTLKTLAPQHTGQVGNSSLNQGFFRVLFIRALHYFGDLKREANLETRLPMWESQGVSSTDIDHRFPQIVGVLLWLMI